MKPASALALAGAFALAACGSPRSGTSAAALWSRHCTSCHGADGRGDPARRTLEPRLDLTASPMVTSHSGGLVFQRIAYGYAAMPGFAHKLELGDLELLRDYVLSLHREP